MGGGSASAAPGPAAGTAPGTAQQPAQSVDYEEVFAYFRLPSLLAASNLFLDEANDIFWKYAYPAVDIDVNVAKTTNNTLMPFPLHAQQRFIQVLIRVYGFDDAKVMGLAQIVQLFAHSLTIRRLHTGYLRELRERT